MEKRILLAIILSFVILILYQILFVKKTPPPSPSTEQVKTEHKTQKIQQKEKIKKIEVREDVVASKIYGEKEVSIKIETPLYKAIWTNRGGLLKSWKLKKHKDDLGNELELVSIAQAEKIKIYPFYIFTDSEEENLKINNSLYHYSTSKLNLKSGEKGEIKFIYAPDENLRVEKSFYFDGDSYLIKPNIKVWLRGKVVIPQILWGPGFRNLIGKEKKRKFSGGTNIAVLVGNKIYRVKEEKAKPEENLYLYPLWAAYEDNYFTALFILDYTKSKARILQIVKDGTKFNFLSINNIKEVFIGPKEYDSLVNLGYNAKKLIKFGFFGWIAEILLKALQFIYKFIPNYGFAIMILTLIIKILFFPLTFSSSKSMAKMQELQPKIKALRAKYKKAKSDIAQRKKLNEEMMRLYKEHGINPAGGCLPLLIQIPVFWGFFRLLLVSIELRHSPFIFWIKDLSVKDPYYVTPILMGVTQYISQKMTPTTADPSQARIMLIMPVIMTLFFMNFQSGLVLYWLTNNILQIAQQFVINRLMKKNKKGKHGGKRK